MLEKYIKNDKLLYITSFLVIFVITFLSSKIYFEHPRLWAEEGVIYLKDALDNGWKTIFKAQLGYYAIVPSVTIYVATLFNYEYIPIITQATSLFFFILTFILILGINDKRFNLKIKVLVSLSLFFIIMGYKEVFLNTINLQFITPSIIFIISLYDQKKMNFLQRTSLNVLTLICLLNGVLGLFLIPYLVYKNFIEKKYITIIFLISVVVFHFFAMINYTGESNLIWRIKNNLNLFQLDIINSFFMSIKKRFVGILFVIFSIYFFKNRKKYKDSNSIILLLSSFFCLSIFLELTKQPHISYLHSRYLVVLYTLLFLIFLKVIIQLEYSKTILILNIVCIGILIGSYKNFNEDLFCYDCPDWSKEYKKLYDKKNDVMFHPLFDKNNKPWSFENNPYKNSNKE